MLKFRLRVQSVNICACLTSIIVLGIISQVLPIPYLELLSNRHNQRGGEQVKHKRRGVDISIIKLVPIVITAFRELSKWKNSLVAVSYHPQ